MWRSFAEVSNSHHSSYLIKLSWKTVYNNSRVSYVCLNFSIRKMSRKKRNLLAILLQKLNQLSTFRETDKILDQKIDSLIDSLNFPDLEKAPKTNLPKLKWTATNDLKNDKDIEIKEADKGGSVVILSKSHCETMILSQI